MQHNQHHYVTFFLAGFLQSFLLAWATPPLRHSSPSLPGKPTFNQTCQSCVLSISRPSLNYSLPPPDPYEYHVPNSPITVTFHSYQKSIPEACARLCISKATREINLHRGKYSHDIIERHLTYQALCTRLFINPWPMMEWGMWNATVIALSHFVSISSDLGMQFDVELDDPSGGDRFVIGLGELSKLPEKRIS